MLFAYQVDPDRFATLETVEEADLDLFIDGFACSPMEATWCAPRVRLSASSAKTGRRLPDFAYVFGSVPILSAAATDALRPMLDGAGELLPLAGHPSPYWALNVTTVVDVLDEEQSQGDWLAPGRMATLRRAVLRDGCPSSLPAIFKLPQLRKGRAILTDHFLKAVAAHGLTGLDPRPLTPRQH